MSLEWSREERVAEYLGRELPLRDEAEALLLDALPARVERVLDLGCGDGRMLALVGDRHPGARLVGLDASAPMLERARQRFRDRPAELLHHDLREPLPALAPFDVVVSGLALHHLEHDRRQRLLGEVRERLLPGGVFADLDLTASPTAELHERFRTAIGRAEDDPDDRLALLQDELRWLAGAGFAEVDCRFRWRELTLLVARAPALGSEP